MADTRAHTAVAKVIRFRGYAREHWLDVEPVCVACNAKRAQTDRELSQSDVSAVLVRMPTWLLSELDDDARDSGRSRNGQLLWLLFRAYPDAAARHPERPMRSNGPRIREDGFDYEWRQSGEEN